MQPAAGTAPTIGAGAEKMGTKEASAPGSKQQTNGAPVPSSSPTGSAANTGEKQNAGDGLSGAPAQSASGRRQRGPFEREQGLSQATPKEGAPGIQEKKGPSAASETNPAAGPPQAAGEEKRHRLWEREQGLSQATPKQEQQGGSTPAASGSAVAPNAMGRNEDAGPFRRHRGAPPSASQGPNQGAPDNAAAQAPSPGGFPRGAENAGTAPAENGGTASEPPRKRKLVLPASAEPSNAKPSQTQPGTDVRTESPPPDTGSSEGQTKEHKCRHKNDEPGSDNGPPSP